MEISSAAIFLANTILITTGLVVLVGGAVIINNLISKYWKPVKVAVFHSLLTDKPLAPKSTEVKPSITKQKITEKTVTE